MPVSNRPPVKVISPRTFFSLDRSPKKSHANLFSFKLPFSSLPASTSFPGSYPNPYIRTRGPGRRRGTIEVSRDDPVRQVCPYTAGWISCKP